MNTRLRKAITIFFGIELVVLNIGAIYYASSFRGWSNASINGESHFDGHPPGEPRDRLSESSDAGILRNLEAKSTLSPKSNPPRTSSESKELIEGLAGNSLGELFENECFKARKNTVPLEKVGKLPRPIINLGFPKMGTTSIHRYFGCGGEITSHFRCGFNFECASCMKESADANLPPLTKCQKDFRINVFSQIDGRVNNNQIYFPQVELLEEIVEGHPNATFLITFRSMEEWYKSLSNWYGNTNTENPNTLPSSVRLQMANITGFPVGKGKNIEEYSDWFCKHVQRVRDIVDKHPSSTLVEIDIEDLNVAKYMEEIFGFDESCWGRANFNKEIHPEIKDVQNLPWLMMRGFGPRGQRVFNVTRLQKHDSISLHNNNANSVDNSATSNGGNGQVQHPASNNRRGMKQIKLSEARNITLAPITIQSLDTTHYTVRMNTFRRNEQLLISLNHHSKCEGIKEIQVIWCDKENDPPEGVLYHPSGKVKVERHEIDSLNERFHILNGTPTLGILSLDDDVLRPCEALDAAFIRWTRNPERIVGFDPRLHLQVSSRWKYSFSSATNNIYSIALTKSCFIHRDYLDAYLAALPGHIMDYIDKKFQCEDIAMSYFVSTLTGGKPPLLADSWAIDSVIKIYSEDNISWQGDHLSSRDGCVNDFAEIMGLKAPAIGQDGLKGAKQLEVFPLTHSKLIQDIGVPSRFTFGSEPESWSSIDHLSLSSTRLQNLTRWLQELELLNDEQYNNTGLEWLKKLETETAEEAKNKGLVKGSVEWNRRWKWNCVTELSQTKETKSCFARPRLNKFKTWFVCDIRKGLMLDSSGSIKGYYAAPAKDTGVHEYIAYSGAPPCVQNGYCSGCSSSTEKIICSAKINSTDCSIETHIIDEPDAKAPSAASKIIKANEPKCSRYPCKRLDLFNNLPSKGKIIFIHIPKTAGTSIENILGVHVSCHVTALQLSSCNREKYDSAITFTVIRHPLDRLVSIYNYAKHGGNKGKSDQEQFAWVKMINSFDEFVNGLDPEHYFYAPMTHYIGNVTSLKVKEVLCIDELAKDWKRLLSQLDPEIRPKSDPSQSHFRIGQKQTSFLMSRVTDEKIRRIYSEDYLLWNQFCGGRPPMLETRISE